MTPAFATLFEPASAASLAIARLRETAIQLQTEGMRGKELRTDEWVTIVNIGRVLPETPPPGRMAPLLRAASRVTHRAADLLSKDVLTTGDHQSLETAADWARAAYVLLLSLSANQYDVAFAGLFSRVDAQKWSGLSRDAHADIRLSLRERDIVMPEWTIDSRAQPIRCDTDGMAAIDELALDPLLYAEQWDLPRLAERLAAGVEVVL